MGMWNRSVETLGREALTELQLNGLRRTLNRVWGNAFHRARLQRAGVAAPEDVRSLADLRLLPFLTEADFAAAYPLAMNCADRRDLMELHFSADSKGSPIAVAYTKNDLLQWAECLARGYAMAGLEQGDALQVMTGLGPDGFGLGAYHGARKAHLLAVPSTDDGARFKVAADFRVRAVVADPAALMASSQALPYLKVGVFDALRLDASCRQALAERWGIESFAACGVVATGGIGTIGHECREHAGIHVWEDCVIAEIVDPETGRPVEDGERGELTVTSVAREAMPFLRYRTGLVTRVVSRERCACGRTSLRIDQDLVRKAG